jgi:hypothetical protein
MLDFSSLLYEDFMKCQTEFQKFRLARFYVEERFPPFSSTSDFCTFVLTDKIIYDMLIT